MSDKIDEPQGMPHFDDYGGSKEITEQFLQVLRESADTLQDYANNIETDCVTTGVYLDITAKQCLVTTFAALWAAMEYIQTRNVGRMATVQEAIEKKKTVREH